MTDRRLRLGRTEHEIVSEQLSSYIDQQLSVLDRARVERHLAACVECREELRSVQWTKQLLRQAPAVRVPRSFVIREADVERVRRVSGRSPALALRWASSVVALLLVLVFASDLLTSGLLTRARLASAPQPYGEVVEKEAVVVESTTLARQATPAGLSDEAPQLVRTPSPTAEPAAKMAEQEQKVEVLGAEAAPTVTPLTPGLAAPGATLQAEQTPVPAAKAAVQESADLTRGAEPAAPAERVTAAAAEPATAEVAMERAALATEPAPTAIPGPGVLREREEGPPRRVASRLNGWRLAEIGLGAVLLALVIAAIWLRLHR